MVDDIKKDNWKEIKEKFYPSEPVIKLGEMDLETLHPWGLPKEESKKANKGSVIDGNK